MEFKTTFTGSDFAAYYQMRSKLLGTGKDTVGRVCLAAVGGLEMLLGAWAFFASIQSIGGMLLAMGLLFFAGGVCYYPILGRRSAKAMPKDVGEISYRFSDSSFTQSHGRGSAAVEYDRVFSAAESREVIALFYDETHGIFFPKRSVSDLEELRILLEEKLGFPMITFNF